jgi:hypothetical protein
VETLQNGSCFIFYTNKTVVIFGDLWHFGYLCTCLSDKRIAESQIGEQNGT